MDYTVPEHFYEFQYGWYRDIDLDYEAEQLLKVLDAAQKENDIQYYIKENKKWFIPASIFKDYDFGHHEAYISIDRVATWSRIQGGLYAAREEFNRVSYCFSGI